MLKLLDELLRTILMEGVQGLQETPAPSHPAPRPPVRKEQVGFAPPDDKWGNDVKTMRLNALNVYLVDLRENRKLRSNERVRSVENGIVYADAAPARLDCHYLITAWNPTEHITPQVEPVLDEHTLLYQAAAVLLTHGPLNPSRVYPANSGPLNAWPARFREVDLPAIVAPVDGFPKLAEFWGAMGQGQRWKPVLYLIVTVPVELVREVAGPMVTTRITEYGLIGSEEPGEVWIQIGGQVLASAPPRQLVVASATVQTVHDEKVTLNPANHAARFKVGDVVTEDNQAFATIRQIQGNQLTLSSRLAQLKAGDTLRIAHIRPAQATFRLTDATGLAADELALFQGADTLQPATVVSERVELQSVNPATGFVTLKAMPGRSRTYKMNVAAAKAPVLIPLFLPAGAWVGLEDAQGTTLQTTATDANGRFTFSQLRAGNYTLRIRMVGTPEKAQVIEVPSPTGTYDVILV